MLVYSAVLEPHDALWIFAFSPSPKLKPRPLERRPVTITIDVLPGILNAPVSPCPISMKASLAPGATPVAMPVLRSLVSPAPLLDPAMVPATCVPCPNL
eukprot:CAMPEP_0194156348 /NCGR_PEP_ID=MMETSP0152-20130528/67972_1 /TAXON_ID=1049557 /ORGANISM="Thalassiothrix antarctica, Strain L6-D1" /LENGTH=98 /DNA_ID=CAMNT_0038863961 /DNA_START=70 /DNA_END=366 /DNA_ORIENTATION=+